MTNQSRIKLKYGEWCFVLIIFAVFLYLYLSDFIGYKSNYGVTAITLPVAMCIFISCVVGFRRLNKPLDPFVIFTLSWSLAFFLNRLEYSSLQFTWATLTELYILFAPILAFAIASLFFVKNKFQNGRLIDAKHLRWLGRASIFLIIISYAILVYEFNSTGIIPLLSNNINEDRVSYSLPFIHVISEAFLKLGAYLLIYYWFVEKKKKYAFWILISAFYFIVTMSRSGLVEMALYALFVYMIISGRGLLGNYKVLLIFIFCAAFIFSLLGDIRQGSDFNISTYAESRIENSAIDWSYSYFAINLDNLALEIERNSPTMTPSNSLRMFIQLIQLDDSLDWFDVSYEYIGRLNLGTGFRGFVNDWGAALSILPMINLFFVVNIIYNKKYKTNIGDPIRAYILVACFMMVLTNRFLELIPFFVITSLILLDFVFGRLRFFNR